jgi:hypothetical protein
LSELNAEWARRVAEAERQARTSGRGDVADYLALRALNDMARATGVEWLLAAFNAQAGEVNRTGAGITLTSEDAHRFRVGNSTMVGNRLTLHAGVRSLSVRGRLAAHAARRLRARRRTRCRARHTLRRPPRGR